ncbi:MAG: hypothetical protein VZR53_01445 [Prevotella sp.]|nr:hypothetical protein [Prevotella sp.]
MGKGYKTYKNTVPYKMNNKEHTTFFKFFLLTLYIMMPKCMFADYSGRHFESSSSDFLLILAFIVIVVITIVLFISDSNRKPHQVKETVTSKQNKSYIPKIDVKNSTIVILSVSALQKRVQSTSYMSAELANFYSFPLSKRNDIQKIINKGACDAAREYKDSFTLIHYKEKRNYYSPPIMYSEYYELAYETVISDSIKLFQIKHDIETGLIQCE